MKTYVITFASRFMKGHPREGDSTLFKEKILLGQKIHTIRANENYWSNIVLQVNKGMAILSVRQWIGKPYASKQKEFIQFNKLGFQPFDIDSCGVMAIDRFYTDENFDEVQFAKNDGLEYTDFVDWFGFTKCPVPEFKGGIIHFTDFRYESKLPIA